MSLYEAFKGYILPTWPGVKHSWRGRWLGRWMFPGKSNQIIALLHCNTWTSSPTPALMQLSPFWPLFWPLYLSMSRLEGGEYQNLKEALWKEARACLGCPWHVFLRTADMHEVLDDFDPYSHWPWLECFLSCWIYGYLELAPGQTCQLNVFLGFAVCFIRLF